MVSSDRSSGLRREEVTLLVSELSSILEGQRIGKVYDAPHGNLRIVIGSGSSRMHLLISVHPGTSRMVLLKESLPAPDRPGEKVARLRTLLSGALVDQVDQPGGDRMMRLRLAFGPPTIGHTRIHEKKKVRAPARPGQASSKCMTLQWLMGLDILGLLQACMQT